jgi:hypothetical protein
MRFNEFQPSIKEGRADNKKTRYNSEVGLLVGFAGVNPTTFDPANPGDPNTGIPGTMLENGGKKIYKDITNLLKPNYDPNMFAAWASRAPEYMQKITAKMGTTPAVFGWAGGANQNAEGAADIEFVDEVIQGVSIKAESGITLRNLTPKALGLAVDRGNDVFFQYAADEYTAMKQGIFTKLLDLAKQKPGEKLSFHKQNPDKYWIMYTPVEGEPLPAAPEAEPTQPAQPDELAAITKNAGLPSSPQQTTIQGNVMKSTPPASIRNMNKTIGTKIPMGAEREEEPFMAEAVNPSQQEGIWTCAGKTSFKGTREQIMTASAKNKKWQRVFGDWFQANYAAEKELATPLYSAIANMFKDTMVEHLTKDRNLDAVLAMGKRPYFYANAADIYYVPSVEEVSDLKIKNVYYGSIQAEGNVVEAEGTSQKFQAEIGRPASTENAKILIYIRYANGMFETNPTVRVQDLKDPQFLGWEKL